MPLRYADASPPWCRWLALVIGLTSAAALAVSALAHFAAYFGCCLISKKQSLVLFFGVFAVMLPYGLIQHFGRIPQNFPWLKLPGKNPRALGRVLLILFAYVVVHFLTSFVLASRQPKDTPPSPASEIRIMTGHLMLFYFLGASMAWAVWNRKRFMSIPVCSHGHEVTASQKYCPECGENLLGR